MNIRNVNAVTSKEQSSHEEKEKPAHYLHSQIYRHGFHIVLEDTENIS